MSESGQFDKLVIVKKMSVFNASVQLLTINFVIERFSIESRKTKTKVIALTNQKGHKQDSEPIKTRSNYV